MTSFPVVRVPVDFTRVRDDDTMSISIERLKDDLGVVLSEREIVELYEGDEQSAWAGVLAVRDYTVVVRVFWSTYRAEFNDMDADVGQLAASGIGPEGESAPIVWEDWGADSVLVLNMTHSTFANVSEQVS